MNEEQFITNLLTEIVKPEYDIQQGEAVAVKYVPGDVPAYDLIVNVKEKNYGQMKLSVLGFFIQKGERESFHADIERDHLDAKGTFTYWRSLLR